MKLTTATIERGKVIETMREIEKVQHDLMGKYMELADNLCDTRDTYGVWHIMSERQKLERHLRTMQIRYGDRR